MKLKPLGSNQSELTLANGTKVFFSYETPVAAFLPAPTAIKLLTEKDRLLSGYIVAVEKYSRTTSKHVNQWIAGSPSTPVKQANIAALLGE